MSSNRITMPTEFESIKEYLVEKLEPLREALTIQILIARNIFDYTALRTEQTRELNTTATPLSFKSPDPVLRVVFLGGKQKAAETRKLGEILRTANRTLGRNDVSQCYLKDKLCMHCPRCALFGAVSTKSGGSEINFKHRIEYSSAFSLLQYEEIAESFTFNAIDEITTKPGQALGETPLVSPANIFPSIVTLNTVTWKEFLLALKSILSTHSYGGETRTRGDMSNTILGIACGWEEIISPLELTLELYDKFQENTNPKYEDMTGSILQDYKKRAAFVSKTRVISTDEVNKIIEQAQKYDLSKDFLDEAYNDIDEFLTKASSLEKADSAKATAKTSRKRK
jgi:CRISPR type I-D-associated protein Csc2